MRRAVQLADEAGIGQLRSISVRNELPGTVRVDIADAGPGIPPEHLAHVFERFHRVDRGRSSASGGTGLGLAIVDAIARAHGGSASVTSQPGRGSTFSLTLPR